MNENQNDFNIEDIYFKDAFTKSEDKLNLEVDNANISCLISKNNKFSLDEEGNLEVNTITYNTSSPVGKTISLTNNVTQVLPANILKEINFQVISSDSDDTTGLLTKVGNGILIGDNVNSIIVEGHYQASPNTALYIYIMKNGEYVKAVQGNNNPTTEISKVMKVNKGDVISLGAYSKVAATISAGGIAWGSLEVTILS